LVNLEGEENKRGEGNKIGQTRHLRESGLKGRGGEKWNELDSSVGYNSFGFWESG
jgi:hypothetical protein